MKGKMLTTIAAGLFAASVFAGTNAVERASSTNAVETTDVKYEPSFAITDISTRDGKTRVDYESVPGGNYSIKANSSLSDSNGWRVVSSGNVARGYTSYHSAPFNSSNKFFKVNWTNAPDTPTETAK